MNIILSSEDMKRIETRYDMTDTKSNGCEDCYLYNQKQNKSCCDDEEQTYCIDNGIIFTGIKDEVMDKNSEEYTAVSEKEAGSCKGCAFTDDNTGDDCSCIDDKMTSECRENRCIYVYDNTSSDPVLEPEVATPAPKTNEGFLSVDIGEEVLIKNRVGGSMQYNMPAGKPNTQSKNWKTIESFFGVRLSNAVPIPVPFKKYTVTHKFFYPNSLNDVYIIQEILKDGENNTPRNYLMNDQGIKKIQKKSIVLGWDLALTCPYCKCNATYTEDDISQTAHESKCPQCGEKASLPNAFNLTPMFN